MVVNHGRLNKIVFCVCSVLLGKLLVGPRQQQLQTQTLKGTEGSKARFDFSRFYFYLPLGVSIYLFK